MIPFCNNLRKGDEVEEAKTKRRGVVTMQPRETSTMVNVRLNGLKTTRYFRVMDLRFVVDGVAEDVAPVDGEPPGYVPPPPKPTPAPQPSALDALLKKRRLLQIKLNAIEEVIFTIVAHSR